LYGNPCRSWLCRICCTACCPSPVVNSSAPHSAFRVQIAQSSPFCSRCGICCSCACSRCMLCTNMSAFHSFSSCRWVSAVAICCTEVYTMGCGTQLSNTTHTSSGSCDGSMGLMFVGMFVPPLLPALLLVLLLLVVLLLLRVGGGLCLGGRRWPVSDCGEGIGVSCWVPRPLPVSSSPYTTFSVTGRLCVMRFSIHNAAVSAARHTRATATYSCPCENGSSRRSRPALFNVCPCALLTVTAYASGRGNCFRRTRIPLRFRVKGK